MCCVAAAFAVLAGCSKTSPLSASPNEPPETVLTAEGTPLPDGGRQVVLRWAGSDEDGSVDRYMVSLDGGDWREVAVTETAVVFAPHGKRQVAMEGEEKHHFAVKSVDDRGGVDPTPAELWFTERNELPETIFIREPAYVTGPMVAFEWLGMDPDGTIAAYDYRLSAYYGGGWVQVVPDPGIAGSVTVGPDVVEVLFGPLAGMHKFEVWATDDEGGADPTPAVSEFVCNPDLAGAKLFVSSNVIGEHRLIGPVWPPEYNEPVDIFPEQLEFDWWADASHYGGEVVGYRHAYDDTSTWPAWSLEDRSFEVLPEPGEHNLYIQVLDNANVITRARFYFNVIDADLSQYILLVDDYDQWEGNPYWGTDAQRDAFYDTLLCSCERPILKWNPEEHLEAGVPQPPDVETLASASTVVWYTDMYDPTLSAVFDPFIDTYRPIAGYVRVGGNLMLAGHEIIRNITDRPYPITLTAADTTAGAVFVRDQLHLGYVWNTGVGANPDSPKNYGYCFLGAVPEAIGIPMVLPGELSPMYVDSLGKWPFYLDPPVPQYARCGLGSVEAFEPYGPIRIQSHVIDAYLNYTFEGRTCVALSLTCTDRGNVSYMGFPLYYLQTRQVKAFFDKVLLLFGEPMAGEVWAAW
jgi:hypothetical protein